MAGRIHWAGVLDHARSIMASYDTGVTLRQLFYRLVADETLPNTRQAYKVLSDRTAKARRAGDFPDFIDRQREITREATFADPDEARAWLREVYRRDRTEGQPLAVYLGIEKVGLIEQAQAWFGELGVPILALGGYSSQTYVDEVADDVYAQQRPAVLLYAGDHDPSGEDIERDFIDRTGCFERATRVALTWDQVLTYDLPPALGKAEDPRAAAFEARHGQLVQVELDALPPDTLRDLFADALAPYWDEDAYDAALQREREDRANL